MKRPEAALRSGLEKNLAPRLWLDTSMRLAAWGPWMVAVWQMLSLADLVFHADPALLHCSAMILVTGGFAVLLWPPSRTGIFAAVRSRDPRTLIEAYMEAPPGPARELLAARLGDGIASVRLQTQAAGPRNRNFPMTKSLAAALACSLCVQIAGFIMVGHPLWGHAAPVMAANSGLRTNAEDFDPGTGTGIDPAGIGKLDEKDSLRERLSGHGATRFAEDDRAEKTAAGKPGFAPGADSAPEKKNAALPESAGPALRREAEGEAPPPPEQPPASTDSGGEKKEGAGGAVEYPEGGIGRQGFGWEKTPDTKIPSPIKEYQSWFERVATHSSGQRSGAVGDLRAEKLTELEKTVFGSFSVAGGIERAEDPYSSLLKRRWKTLRNTIR